jgi:hypothetical protein
MVLTDTVGDDVGSNFPFVIGNTYSSRYDIPMCGSQQGRMWRSGNLVTLSPPCMDPYSMPRWLLRLHSRTTGFH